MKIDEAKWQKFGVAVLAAVTTTLIFGNTVFGWHFGTEQQTAIVDEVSAVLTLITVVLYGANSTVNSAVREYIAGAWRLGKAEQAAGGVMPDGGPFRVGAARGVAPTREQVARFVEHEPAP